FGSGEFQPWNTTTVPYQTVIEYTSADVTAIPETQEPVVTDKDPSEPSGELPRDQQPILYETTLNCNGKSYTLMARLHTIRGEESIDGVTVTELDKNYIWGDVSLELLLDGKLTDISYICEYCYGVGQVGGMPFDRENLGNDYFRVLNMGQDVLAYLTPNAEIGAEDENEGAILNAMLFTVSKDDHLVTIQRYVTDEEKAELGTRPNGELTLYDGRCFKLTPDFDVEPDRLTLHLNRTVENPWSENGTVFPAGDIPVSVDFESYRIRCEDEYYKYLVYYYTDPWYPPLTLMDGSTALNSTILKYDHLTQGDFDHYSVNSCFAVPFFTPAENRAAGEEGAWFKVKKGYHIWNYYVQSVVCDYCIKENEGYPYMYQCVIDLYGDLNSTAAAEKLYDSAGEVSAIKITLDREYCEGLFGVEPCIKGDSNSEKNFDDDRACFILTEKMKYYYKVLNSLNDRDSVKVNLSAKEFSLSYHYNTGYTYDGMTLLDFDDDSYTLEILE
ncbi:MAG: hypothetical protein K2J79_02450, partial [Ruminiclostridium sp.]|nr:hypothetical protein [Ruminiclostridium sp.]